MGIVDGRRAAAIVAAVGVVLAGTFVGGHLLGRAVGADPAAGPPPAAGSPATVPAGPPPAAGTSPAASPPPAASSPPAASPPPAADPVREVEAANESRRPAATQPFTGPGRPPLPRAAGPYGSRPTTGAGYVALTFDDGPHPEWTPQVLTLLRRYEVTATFCVVGELVEAYPDLMREIAADGHTLCNHTWRHDIGLGGRSRAEIRRDLVQTTAAIRAAVPGARISYYRQPGGAWTQRVVDVAEELGMTSLHWAVDPRDWAGPGAAAIASTVTGGTAEGAIVLLHDGGGDRRQTVAALRTILPDLAGRFVLDGPPPGIDPPRRYGVELPAKPSQL